MRRLIGERALGVAVVIFGAAVAFGVWFLASQPARTVTRVRTGPALVVVQPPTTPLRDSIREPKVTKEGSVSTSHREAAAGTPTSRATTCSSRPIASQRCAVPSPAQSPTRKRRVPSRKRKTTASPQKPPQGGTAPYTQPTPPPEQPGVTVPLPGVCLPPVKVGNC